MKSIENILRKDLGFKPFKESLNHKNINKIKKPNSLRYAEVYNYIINDSLANDNNALKLLNAYSEADETTKKGMMSKIKDAGQNLWKQIKILIGKLVIFLEEQISKFFDKSNKLDKAVKSLMELYKNNKEKIDSGIVFKVYNLEDHGKPITTKDLNTFLENTNVDLDYREKDKTLNLELIYEHIENGSDDELKSSKEWKDIKKEIKEIDPANINMREYHKMDTAKVSLIFKNVDKFVSSALYYISIVIMNEEANKKVNNYDLHEYDKTYILDLINNVRTYLPIYRSARKFYFEQKRMGLYIKNLPNEKISKIDKGTMLVIRKTINYFTKYTHRNIRTKTKQINQLYKAVNMTYKSLSDALK